MFAQTVRITVEPQVQTIKAGTYFDVKIWIRDLEVSNPMAAFRFIITWDGSLIDFNGHSVNMLAGWTTSIAYGITNDGRNYFTIEGIAAGSGDAVTVDRYWETFSFHCLGPGATPINLPSTITDEDGFTTYTTYVNGINIGYTPTTVKGAVNQYELAPVGGVQIPINKIEVLVPYLALAGLIIAVSTVYVIKRRKE